MVTFPETTTCEAMKQWSPISTSCPMWLPLQSTTSLPIRTPGWTTFASKTKQLSPIGTSGQNIALELT